MKRIMEILFRELSDAESFCLFTLSMIAIGTAMFSIIL